MSRSKTHAFYSDTKGDKEFKVVINRCDICNDRIMCADDIETQIDMLNAEYISPQQRAQLRQMAVDEGIIAPGTTLPPEDKTPPNGTYS